MSGTLRELYGLARNELAERTSIAESTPSAPERGQDALGAEREGAGAGVKRARRDARLPEREPRYGRPGAPRARPDGKGSRRSI